MAPLRMYTSATAAMASSSWSMGWEIDAMAIFAALPVRLKTPAPNVKALTWVEEPYLVRLDLTMYWSWARVRR
jgi:hypothetical protein